MIFAKLNTTFSQFTQRFYQRYPAATAQLFTRRNVFIFPSSNGLWFLLLTALLWLIGTNYENNLVLLLAFLLTTLFVVSILHTFANLSGVSVELLDTKPAFSGDEAEVVVMVRRRGKRPRENILLGWVNGSTATIDLIDKDEITTSLFVYTGGRGWFNPGRLLIETYFPLGLLRCWAWPDLDCRILTYPKPIPAGPLPVAAATNDEGDYTLVSGSEDFAGYRNYQMGDSLRNVAWKQYARGVGVYSKEYVTLTDSRLWLDWEQFAGMDREERLSRLCFWVLQAYAANRDYGLRLPGLQIPLASGLTHKLEALKALALFGVGERLTNRDTEATSDSSAGIAR